MSMIDRNEYYNINIGLIVIVNYIRVKTKETSMSTVELCLIVSLFIYNTPGQYTVM